MSESLLKEFRVTLETVTPLFLGGAEPRPSEKASGMPELRPPSLRGSMRYWFRALMGGIYGDSDKDLILKMEKQAFGGVAENNSGGASQVAIKIRNEKLKELKKYEKIKGPNGRALIPPAGRDYLYWSMDRSGSVERNNLLQARYFIPADSSFDVHLDFKPLVEAELIKQIVYSFWLSVQLGGIGARSRRTAGSLHLGSNSHEYLPAPLRLGTQDDIANQLGISLTNIRKSLGASLPRPTIHAPAHFDVLHPNVCKIWVLGVAKNSEGMVKAIGERMQTYRNHTPNGQNRETWLLERSIFGMPVKGLKGIERRASPLWLKISKVGEYYAGIATLFKSQLLPKKDQDEKMCFKEPGANYSIVEAWVSESFNEAAEVKYE